MCILDNVLVAAIALLALVGRGAIATGLAFHAGWILLVLVVIEVVYRWVARRLSDDLH